MFGLYLSSLPRHVHNFKVNSHVQLFRLVEERRSCISTNIDNAWWRERRNVPRRTSHTEGCVPVSRPVPVLGMLYLQVTILYKLYSLGLGFFLEEPLGSLSIKLDAHQLHIISCL